MSDEVAETDAAQADIGIVCALPMELAEFVKRCDRVRSYSGRNFTFRGGHYRDIRVVVVEAGTGQNRARRATQALIDAHHPRWILSCGYAGGLNADAKIGDIVVGNRLVRPDGSEIHVDFRMPSDHQRRQFVGGVVTVDSIVRTVDEKRSIGEQFQALAVDMETYAVAELCRELRQKFFAVRVLSDDAQRNLPPEVLSLLGATGAVRFGAILGALWKRPGSYQDMLQLRDQAQIASTRLADFLDGVVQQLYREV